jgi:hypothetical protein
MDTWAKEIINSSDLSDNFQIEISKIQKNNSSEIPFTIKIPCNSNYNTPETVIVSFNSSLYILENFDDKTISTKILYSDINFIEITIILLNSSILINNGYENKKIYFNTSSEEYFHKIIKKIRKFQNSQINTNSESTKLDYLKDINLKLFNYSKYAMKYHEKIIDTVYQPTDKKNNIESNLTILSNNELVFIKEPNEKDKPKSSVYGGIWIFIPINKIQNILIENKKNERLFLLNIIFSNNNNYHFTYTYNTKSSFKEFDKEIKKLLL